MYILAGERRQRQRNVLNFLKKRDLNTCLRNTGAIRRPKANVKRIVFQRNAKTRWPDNITLKHWLPNQKIYEDKEKSPHISLTELVTGKCQEKRQAKHCISSSHSPLAKEESHCGVSQARQERTGGVLSLLSQLWR